MSISQTGKRKKKRCYACLRTLAATKFYKNKSKKDGLTDECKECKKRMVPTGKRREKYLAYQKRYNAQNQEHRREQARVRYKRQGVRDGLKARLKRRGLTLIDYDNKFEEQGGVCAICQNPSRDTLKKTPRGLHIDHCHTTGEFRGLLCSTCNRGLGSFYDNTDYLDAAIKYLKRKNATDNKDYRDLQPTA